MNAEIKQCSAINPNPVLSIEKDGSVLYSNEAGKDLLREWEVKVGEKLPAHIRDIAQRVLFKNIPEKMEVQTESRVYLLFFQPLPAEELVNIYVFEISEQKKLEEELRESEEKLKHIVKYAPSGVFEIDFSGPRYLNVNDAFCQMSGYTREELLAISPFELMVDDSKHKLNERIKKSLSGEEISPQEEYLVVGKNGRKLWVLINAHFTYKHGKIVGALVIAHDITERKQAVKTLYKSERHYRLLFETMHQGIVYYDADGKIIFINPAAERILGNNPAEFLDGSCAGEKYYTIREDGSPFPVIEHPAMASLMTGKEVHNVVMGVYNTQENCYHWINTSSVPIIVPGEDKPFQVYTLLDDITERRKAEDKLRESEEKYRNIVETANEGISIVDAEFRVTYINKRIEDMFGYSSEEVIGKLMWGFISGDSGDFIKQILKKGLNSINESIEIKCMRKDGLPFWAHVNAKSLFDKEGRFMGVITMLTDINKRKEAEEALASIEIARKKEIHHRIKNNLQVISSLLDLQADKIKHKKNITKSEVLEAFKESQDRAISMALIHEELHKGGEIDTLNFSHYIEELADNLLQTYRLRNESVILDADIEEDIFFDMDTAVPLGIIINELLSNSLKYAFPDRHNGEIRIKLHREECSSTTFVLIVSDNGIGIPDNLIIDDLDSLGLQLVTTLVKQLDGKLELKRDKGTEFSIKFKVNEQASTPQNSLIE